MSKILVFQHVAAEPLGTLDALIRSRGHRIRFVNFFRNPEAEPLVERYDGLVVLGGPMNIGDPRHPHLAFEIAALKRAIELDIPTLGICLGAQLLACASGGSSGPAPTWEIGWRTFDRTGHGHADPVLRHLNTPHVFQWHGCTFRPSSDATLLAIGTDVHHQAFKVGSAYGFQFHLEMDEPLIRRWLGRPDYAAELQASGLADTPGSILTQIATHLPPMQASAHRVFSAFLDRVGEARRRRMVPSR